MSTYAFELQQHQPTPSVGYQQAQQPNVCLPSANASSMASSLLSSHFLSNLAPYIPQSSPFSTVATPSLSTGTGQTSQAAELIAAFLSGKASIVMNSAVANPSPIGAQQEGASGRGFDGFVAQEGMGGAGGQGGSERRERLDARTVEALFVQSQQEVAQQQLFLAYQQQLNVYQQPTFQPNAPSSFHYQVEQNFQPIAPAFYLDHASAGVFPSDLAGFPSTASSHAQPQQPSSSPSHRSSVVDDRSRASTASDSPLLSDLELFADASSFPDVSSSNLFPRGDDDFSFGLDQGGKQETIAPFYLNGADLGGAGQGEGWAVGPDDGDFASMMQTLEQGGLSKASSPESGPASPYQFNLFLPEQKTRFNAVAAAAVHEHQHQQASVGAAEDPKKKHECGICYRSFARAYNLKSHMATHDPSRLKPFTCPHNKCGRSFSRSHDLERHRAGIHADGPLHEKGVKPTNYGSKANRRAIRGVSSGSSSGFAA